MDRSTEAADALQDRSYTDRWGVRIRIVWDAVRGQPPEELARRRARLERAVQEIRQSHARRMADAGEGECHEAMDAGGV